MSPAVSEWVPQCSLVCLHLDFIDGVLLLRLAAAVLLVSSLHPKTLKESLQHHSTAHEPEQATSRVCR